MDLGIFPALVGKYLHSDLANALAPEGYRRVFKLDLGRFTEDRLHLAQQIFVSLTLGNHAVDELLKCLYLLALLLDDGLESRLLLDKHFKWL